MMKIHLNTPTVIFYFLIFYSCKTNEIKDLDANSLVINKPQSVEDYIKDLHKNGSAVQVLDLSNKQLKEVPNLAKLKVSTLDLSNNQLSSIDFSRLPDSLNNLNLSHNDMEGTLIIRSEDIQKIDTLNLSHNKLNYVNVGVPSYKLDFSYNDLTNIQFNHDNVQYLDISYNKNHSNRTQFDPYLIKTIKRDGIANDKPLIANWRSDGPVKDDYLIIDKPE